MKPGSFAGSMANGATERARELGIDVDTDADGSPVHHVISNNPYTVDEASAVSPSADTTQTLCVCSTPFFSQVTLDCLRLRFGTGVEPAHGSWCERTDRRLHYSGSESCLGSC